MVWLIPILPALFILIVKIIKIGSFLVVPASVLIILAVFCSISVFITMNLISQFVLNFIELKTLHRFYENKTFDIIDILAPLNSSTEESKAFLCEHRNDDGEIFYEYMIQEEKGEKSKTLQCFDDVTIIKTSNSKAQLLTKIEVPNTKYLFWCVFECCNDECCCEEITYTFTIPENSIKYK